MSILYIENTKIVTAHFPVVFWRIRVTDNKDYSYLGTVINLILIYFI